METFIKLVYVYGTILSYLTKTNSCTHLLVHHEFNAGNICITYYLNLTRKSIHISPVNE